MVLVGKEPILDGERTLGYVTSAGWGATVEGEHRLRLPARRALEGGHAGEHPQRGAARGGHGRRRAALRPDHGPPARHHAGGRPMTVTEVRSPERPTAGDAALVASLKRPRYEIFPLDGVEDEVARHIPAEVKLTIMASPSKGMEPTLKLAERLRRRGYPSSIGVPFSVARISPGGLKVLDALISMNLIQRSAWL